MPISALHPDYLEASDEMELCRDSYKIVAIKKARDKYLPPTSGHVLDGFGKGSDQIGTKAYNAYLSRAYYPDIFKEAVEASIGIMHKKPATIELPAVLEPLRLRATNTGDSLEQLLRRINTEQLISGRLGLLGDIIAEGPQAGQLNIVMYLEKAIRNWQELSTGGTDFKMVILDESGFEMDPDFVWKLKEKYLVLALLTGDESKTISEIGTYHFATGLPSDEFEALEFLPANYKGRTSEVVPFVTINCSDLLAKPDQPPLLGLANLCLCVYRGEADYRQTLFMQGQDTLVKIGNFTDDETTTRVGSGSSISVPLGGDVKYIGVNSKGLSEQRSALENDYKRAYSKSGQITDATSRAKESGDALRIRVAAQSATLPQIAQAGAAGLELVLKKMATWMGANPDEVVIKPNLDFADQEISGQTILQLAQAKTAGAPLSSQSIHAYMQERGITKLTYEEELALIAAEEPTL